MVTALANPPRASRPPFALRIDSLHITSVVLALPLLLPQNRAGATELKVMTYNIWVGGRGSAQPLSQTAGVIDATGADLIGLQEQSGATEQLAQMLGFNFHVQNSDISYLSRYPISSTLGNGIEVDIGDNQFAYLFNIHFSPYPYGPYDLRDDPSLTPEDLIETADNTRRGSNLSLLNTMRPILEAGNPVFYLGDFNEPSHLDWTIEAAAAGLHFGTAVQWPTSLAIAEAGLIDSYRTLRSDEVADPAETWTPGAPAPFVPAGEVHDRIDIIYHQGFGVEVTDIAIVGENADHADIVVTPYPSDHRAVVATYDLPPTPLLGDVNLDGVIDQADASVIIDHWMEEFEFGGVTTFVMGDLDRNGIVDISDVNIFQLGLVAANPQAAIDWSGLGGGVPEPSSLSLLIAGMTFFAARRRAR